MSWGNGHIRKDGAKERERLVRRVQFPHARQFLTFPTQCDSSTIHSCTGNIPLPPQTLSLPSDLFRGPGRGKKSHEDCVDMSLPFHLELPEN